MISFSCSTCQKSLAVEEDLAGKKGTCTGCGSSLDIPVLVGASYSDELMRTLPPSQDQRTRPSRVDDDGATHPPSGDPDATEGTVKPDAGYDSGLTDFLAPSQSGDELGRLGKYRILGVLGHGGMGVVYRAEDPVLKRGVAIKAMLPTLAASASAGRRFLREAQAMAAVEHDHIVRIHQVDEARGVPFLVMEFLRGEPLDVRLRRDEKVPLSEVLRIGREIAEGLAAAHATGLIHRDVKPANVWLEAPRGRVKILDFGLARAASHDAGLTQQGAILGTPAFMAPEQARGETVDARCDLFSLGVVLYRLCTGRQPFKGKDSVSTLMVVALEEPPPPIASNGEIPLALSDLVMGLMQKNADRRPASADLVVEAFRALEHQQARREEPREDTVALEPVPAKPAAAPRKRRVPLLVAAMVVLVGLIGVGAFALIRIQGEQGDYVIDTDDPDFAFRVSKGAVTLEDSQTKRKYELKVVRRGKATGEYELEVVEPATGLSFKTKTFTIKRGEKAALQAWFERKQAPIAKGTPARIDDAWRKRVAAMPTDEQVGAVAAKLKELNPGFDGKVTHEVADGAVTSLIFVTDAVTDISPVRALPGLRKLECTGSDRGKGKLADLSPLEGMKLTNLSCHSNQVSDLSPLKGMKLLQLRCHGTRVSDLSPLEGMRLSYLACHKTQVSDLSPLEGMRLTYLDCSYSQVGSLSPLKGMKLTTLGCNITQVSDLTPLKGMELAILSINGTQVTDLSPLKGMPLRTIRCTFVPERDAEILLSLVTLETINQKPAKEFWEGVNVRRAAFQAWLKRVAAMPADEQVRAVAAKLKELNPGFDGEVTHKVEGGVVTALQFVTDEVTDVSPVRALPGLRLLECNGSASGKGKLADLSPLKGMKLTNLACYFTQVSDLSPLEGMKLRRLHCSGTRVSDLSALKGTELSNLHCAGTRISDLSPLTGMKLTYLDCSRTPVSDLSPLKGMNLTGLACGVTKVSDLSPLMGMKLTNLNCERSKVTDLSPLKGMPLKTIRCPFVAERDAGLLRSLETLETINQQPAKEFWEGVDARQVAAAWLKRVAAMPADEQAAAVAARLKELNPGFDGEVAHKVEGGVVTELQFCTDEVTDISPVRALPGLGKLDCAGSRRRTGKFADLSPLKGMKLRHLICNSTQVSDLTPLKGTGLTTLVCFHTRVSDLSPLKGSKLTALNCGGTPVSDLSPLKGMKLTALRCWVVVLLGEQFA